MGALQAAWLNLRTPVLLVRFSLLFASETSDLDLFLLRLETGLLASFFQSWLVGLFADFYLNICDLSLDGVYAQRQMSRMGGHQNNNTSLINCYYQPKVVIWVAQHVSKYLREEILLIGLAQNSVAAARACWTISALKFQPGQRRWKRRGKRGGSRKQRSIPVVCSAGHS